MKLKIAALLAIALAVTISVQAQSKLYGWSVTGYYTGSGTLTIDTSTATPDAGEFNGNGYDYTITGFTVTSATFNIGTLTSGYLDFANAIAPTTSWDISDQYLDAIVGGSTGSIKNINDNGDFESNVIIFSNPSHHNGNTFTLSPTPEPSTLAMIGLGMAGLIAARRRK